MAKNSTAPSEIKIRLFISYSREDKAKVDALHEALSESDDFDVYLDTHDIEAGVDWKTRLEDFIRSADSVLFVLSPNSMSSKECRWEMELADSLNKRVIPVVVRDVSNDAIPQTISKLNYIFCRKNAEFETALVSIEQALKIDIDWIREHTRIADLAHRWEQSQRIGAQPLRGKELDDAEMWLATQPKDGQAPTRLQRRYIYESRKANTKRQRFTVAGAMGALLIFCFMATYAWLQRNDAINGEAKANNALKAALEASTTLTTELAFQFRDLGIPSSTADLILENVKQLHNQLLAEFPSEGKISIASVYQLQVSAKQAAQTANYGLATSLLDEAILIVRRSFEGKSENAVMESVLVSLLVDKAEAARAQANHELEVKLLNEAIKLAESPAAQILDIRMRVIRHGSVLIGYYSHHAYLNEYNSALKYAQLAYDLYAELLNNYSHINFVRQNYYVTASMVGNASNQTGQFKQAEIYLKNAIKGLRKEVKAFPNDISRKRSLTEALVNYTVTLSEFKKLAELRALRSEITELTRQIANFDMTDSEDAIELAKALLSEASGLEAANDGSRTIKIREAITLLSGWLEKGDVNRNHIFLMANARKMYGFDLILDDNLEQGIGEFSSACAQFEELDKKGWIINSDLSVISKCYGTLAEYQESAGRLNAAKSNYVAAISWASNAARKAAQSNHLSHFNLIGRFLKKLGDTEIGDKKTAHYVSSKKAFSTAVKAGHLDEQDILGYIEVLDFLATSGGQNSNFEEAEKLLQTAREIFTQNVEIASDGKFLVSYDSYLESTGAEIALMQKHFDRAEKLYEKAVRKIDRLLQLRPSFRKHFEIIRTKAARNIGYSQFLQGNYEAASDSYQNVLSNRRRLLSSNPKDFDKARLLNGILIDISKIAYRERKPDEASEYTAAQLRLLERYGDDDENREETLRLYLRAKSNLGWYLLLAGKFKEAEKVLEEVRAVEPMNVYIHLNLAHSKLFLDKFTVAFELYKGRIDEVIDGKRWHEIVALDFEKFRSYNHSHSDMGKILKSLK